MWILQGSLVFTNLEEIFTESPQTSKEFPEVQAINVPECMPILIFHYSFPRASCWSFIPSFLTLSRSL